MTAEEDRNLKVTDTWVETYNNAVERMVDECYAPDCVVEEMIGGRVFRGREELRAVELQIRAAAPARRMAPTRIFATGDTVVVETLAFGTPGFEDASEGRKAVIVLRFKDGLIVSDHTYGGGPGPKPGA
jgi:hypothetical protein